MKFFFPDSQDLVDPSFDFKTEERSLDRVRQRDDLYSHEVFSTPPFDGVLISKAVVDGHSGGSGRYTLGQRRRLMVEGIREFMRLPDGIESMGDCGAFAYVREPVPPVTVEEVAEFYQEVGFDVGASVDHIILEYKEKWDHAFPGIDVVPQACRDRQELTLELARSFLKHTKKQKCDFQPMGVAQGWSPKSYAASVAALQKMGYTYIALGGLVPLKDAEIVAVLNEVSRKRHQKTGLHLFGVSRLSKIAEFQQAGVVSFDSTSPLRQAFMEDRGNYYGATENYTALRIPQVDANPSLKNRIRSGAVDQRTAINLERECLDLVIRFGSGKGKKSEVLRALLEYQALCGTETDYSGDYQKVLEDRPWEDCPCEVCEQIGIHVLLFRGAERNRRRGFHNVYTVYRRLELLRSDLEKTTS